MNYGYKNCKFCQKETIIRLIMSIYGLRATDIAKAINVSDSLVRKHLDGVRNCNEVDAYLIHLCFGEVLSCMK